MRYRTPKRQKIERAARKVELDFLQEMRGCAVCGSLQFAVHHIFAGKYRERALLVRAAWLPACWACNSDALEDKAQWPYERQLALKLICDPSYFDLAEINRLVGIKDDPHPPQRFTLADVAPWLLVRADFHEFGGIA